MKLYVNFKTFYHPNFFVEYRTSCVKLVALKGTEFQNCATFRRFDSSICQRIQEYSNNTCNAKL